MLAKAVSAIPAADSVEGGWAYEPKWDGFRCIVIRDGERIALDSRSRKPLTEYFPEVVAAVQQWAPPRCVLDAEVFVRAGEPGAEHLDWAALSQRIHPAASRIEKLSTQTPAELVCFDLLALDDENFMPRSYAERRASLEQVFAAQTCHPAIHLTRNSYSDELAGQWFVAFEGAGLDGVIAKARHGRYSPGERRSNTSAPRRRSSLAIASIALAKASAHYCSACMTRLATYCQLAASAPSPIRCASLWLSNCNN